MRKIILSALIAGAAVAATPASAQSWRIQPFAAGQIQSDISQLQNQISRATQRRTVSQREANGLRRQANQVQRLFNQYRRNGLTRSEVSTLESQVNAVRVRLRLERRDWDGRRG